MLMFDTVEELQAHYKAVKKRIEDRAKPKPKLATLPQPKPLSLPQNPVLTHRIRLKYEIKNGAFVSTGKLGHDKLTYQQVVHIICREFKVEPTELFGRCRRLADVRHLCWAIARVMCPHMSLPQIGRHSNGFDHTSVLHGVEKARDRAVPFIKALQSGELRVD